MLAKPRAACRFFIVSRTLCITRVGAVEYCVFTSSVQDSSPPTPETQSVAFANHLMVGYDEDTVAVGLS